MREVTENGTEGQNYLAEKVKIFSKVMESGVNPPHLYERRGSKTDRKCIQKCQ